MMHICGQVNVLAVSIRLISTYKAIGARVMSVDVVMQIGTNCSILI